MTTWLDTSRIQFKTIDGLSIRFAESEGGGDHALLLSPWPQSLLAFAGSDALSLTARPQCDLAGLTKTKVATVTPTAG